MISFCKKHLSFLCNSNFSRYVCNVLAWITVLVILLKKKKKDHVFLINMALGDSLYSLSFIQNIINSYGAENVVIVTSNRYKPVVQSFKFGIRQVFLSHMGVRHFFVQCLCFPPEKSRISFFAYKMKIYPALTYPCRWLKTGEKGNRKLLSKLYGVSVMPIIYHQIPEQTITSIKNFDQEYKKICIINPYSNSMNNSVCVYEMIADVLRKKGYVVYTNVVGNQKPVKGTLPLFCSVYELYSIASKIPLIVSVRSGILDFLIPSKINMFVVYELRDWEDFWIHDHFSLSEWHPEGTIEETVLKNDGDEIQVVTQFESFLYRLSRVS